MTESPTALSTDRPDAGIVLANRSAELEFSDLSPETVTAAKWGLLDTLGVCMAATTSSPEYLDPVRAFLRDAPAGPVSAPTLGAHLTPLDAMLWLGSLAHTLDFDDVAGYSHPSAPAAVSALAAGHASGASGSDLLTAVAVGQDMVIRLAQALNGPISQYGWLPSIPGVLGSAISTSRVLRLTNVQTRDALGLALHQTAGTMQALAEQGSAYRAMREGLNTRAGATAAYLAQAGMPGDLEPIEGRFGFFQQYFGGDYDPTFLHAPDLLGPITSFKPWPCAGHPQLFLTAAKELMDRGEIDTAQIENIRIVGCSDLLPHQCEPIDERSAPDHSIDAKVSIPFLLGKLMVKGDLLIEDFASAGLDDPAATAIGRRVRWDLDPSLRRGNNDFGVGLLRIEHSDGRVASTSVDFPHGHPQNPLAWDSITTKFRQCLTAAGGGMADRADAVISLVSDLERLDDVRPLLDTLAG